MGCVRQLRMTLVVGAIYCKMPKARSDIRRKRRIARDIEKQASRTVPFFPRQAFSRLVREVIQDVSDGQVYSVRADAMQAIQYASEDYLTDAFADANNICCYTNRDTVTSADLRLALGAKATGRGTVEELQPPGASPAEVELVAQS